MCYSSAAAVAAGRAMVAVAVAAVSCKSLWW
jgi:hypothetical protein